MHMRRMSYGFGVDHPNMEADLLEGLCEGFVRANQVQIRVDPEKYPCCLGCGEYKYVPPKSCRVFDWRTGQARDPNCQHVHGAFPLNQRGMGTCIDLACMLCAIFREKDSDAAARVVIEHQFEEGGEPKPGQYHALVMKGNGELVDPEEKAKGAHGGSEGQACACGGHE